MKSINVMRWWAEAMCFVIFDFELTRKKTKDMLQIFASELNTRVFCHCFDVSSLSNRIHCARNQAGSFVRLLFIAWMFEDFLQHCFNDQIDTLIVAGLNETKIRILV